MISPVRYRPDNFPPRALDWGRLVPLLGPATAALARYDGLLATIPNPDVLLSPLTLQEAVLSSRIEGTQATLGEVLEFEAGQGEVGEEKRWDIQEILNYREAMREAEKVLAKLSLLLRVLRKAHKILMSGVRGRLRAPGEFRKQQNWIGPPGCSHGEATYIPTPPEMLANQPNRWERFFHEDYDDILVQTALLHAEFEAIHPFLDGNGRIGRLLIPLFLWKKGMISTPRFYISAYFERYRNEYYERLLAVSRDEDWTGWCAFFLEATREQAESNAARARGILDLYEDFKQRLPEMTRSGYFIQALDFILARPVFSSPVFIKSAGIPIPTARRVLDILRTNGVIKVLQEGRTRRPYVYVFAALLNAAEGRHVF